MKHEKELSGMLDLLTAARAAERNREFKLADALGAAAAMKLARAIRIQRKHERHDDERHSH